MKEKSGSSAGNSFTVVGVVDAGSGRRAVAYWSCGGVEKERRPFGKKSCVRRENLD